MKVLVDTSVWVDFFNGHESAEANALVRLLEDDADVLTCGLIATEVLQGLRRGKALDSIQRHFAEMEWLTPSEPQSYFAAADLFRALRKRGLTIRSTIDCLIARLAHERGALLLTKDRDLRTIVASKLLSLDLLPTHA